MDDEPAQELDFARYLRAGDSLLWAQASAEPRTLIEQLLAHQAGPRAVPGLRAFVGIPGGDGIAPEHARRLALTSYTGSGGNAALHAAGLLDILPAHYSSFPGLIARGAIGADVVLVQLPPPDDRGRYSLGLARDYLVAALRGMYGQSFWLALGKALAISVLYFITFSIVSTLLLVLALFRI